MPLFSRLMFEAMDWAARRGLRDDEAFTSTGKPAAAERKLEARRTGIRGETYAYWFLRRHGYIFIAKNYTAPGLKGEIDLVGYDGPALAFVEVRARTAGIAAQAPEETVTREKRRFLVRMARRFLAERGIAECPCRFDVLAIENHHGRRPVVRLHKGAFAAQE